MASILPIQSEHSYSRAQCYIIEYETEAHHISLIIIEALSLSLTLAMSTPIKEVYSLSNPPKAPKKPPAPEWREWAVVGIPPFPNLETEEEDEKAALSLEYEWAIIDAEREILEGWDLRPKLLRWTPSEVQFIESKETLQFLYKRFAHPCSQPRNTDEIIFHRMIEEAVLERMVTLNLSLYD